MKATEQYFTVTLFVMLYKYKMVLNFESVDEILKCDHLNESNWEARCGVVVYYAARGSSHFGLLAEVLKCDHSSKSY